MKKQLYIFGIIFLIMLNFVKCKDEIYEQTRLFRPSFFTSLTEVNGDTIYVAWRESGDAISYSIELGRDSTFATTDFSAVTENTSYTFTGLAYKTDYYVRVRANNEDSTKNSNWTVYDEAITTDSRTVPVILNSIEDEDIGQDSVRISWVLDDNNPVDSLTIVDVDASDTTGMMLPETAIENGYYTITGLSAKTEYAVTLYNSTASADNQNYNTRTFTTFSDIPDGATEIGTNDDLASILEEDLADDDVDSCVYYLSGGASYYMTTVDTLESGELSPVDAKSFTITKSVKFISTSSDRPTLYFTTGKWTFSGNVDFFIVDNVNIEGLTNFSGSFNAGTYFFSMNAPDEETTVNKLSFLNCNITNLPRFLIRSDSKTPAYNIYKFTMDNCIYTCTDTITKTGGYGVYEFIKGGDNDVFGDITITNSTFYNIPRQKGLFAQPSSSGTSVVNVDVENCTFYLFSSSSDQGGKNCPIIDFNKMTSATVNLTVKNNLYAYATALVQFVSSGSLDTDDNYYITGTVDNDGYGTSTSSKMSDYNPKAAGTEDEIFEDASNGDFSIIDQTSDVYKNSIGDPRWIK